MAGSLWYSGSRSRANTGTAFAGMMIAELWQWACPHGPEALHTSPCGTTGLCIRIAAAPDGSVSHLLHDHLIFDRVVPKFGVESGQPIHADGRGQPPFAWVWLAMLGRRTGPLPAAPVLPAWLLVHGARCSRHSCGRSIMTPSLGNAVSNLPPSHRLPDSAAAQACRRVRGVHAHLWAARRTG
jgi:hypothetical protein